ncbi:MAG: social motility TPR repeat lipoprotein Tgl [Myxococcaceae bacterium]
MLVRLAPLFAALLLAGCKHLPTEKEEQGAQIHYDLGVQLQQVDPQGAFKEFEAALTLFPDFPEAHNAIAVILHLAFNRGDEAIIHYQRALLLRPAFTEVKTNLANVYLDQKRYDEAIALYEQALNDMLYATPFIAQGNLGWAFYKKGETRKAIDSIKAALTTNPKFCLGHKNLGIIYDEQGNTADACKQFTRYREGCPDAADAYFREGVCLSKQGEGAAAKTSFEGCVKTAKGEDLKDDCRRLAEKLGP